MDFASNDYYQFPNACLSVCRFLQDASKNTGYMAVDYVFVGNLSKPTVKVISVHGEDESFFRKYFEEEFCKPSKIIMAIISKIIRKQL